VNHPLLIKVRGRKSKKSDKGINFEDALLNYNKSFKKKDEDMKAFM
ncbi:MAG: hypothetical protein ISS48_04380, partial [Candidatus Aenigmarchaeota archaeon]|nr:hypothetical protein [Candidatus Aenigmarchaeota archaeon]